MAMATERERAQSREAEAIVVGPLLARANLLRMRKQWDEAIAVCTEALRKAPDSVTAHSLLGDIYEAQGRLEDAIQWYGMAVEIDPDSTVDRVKLERLVQAQRTRLKAVEPPPVPAAPPAKEKTIERTIEWFDRAFPPGKSESIARLLFAMSGGIAFVLAIGFVYVYYFLPRQGGSQLVPMLTEPSAHPLPTVVMHPPTVAAPPSVTTVVPPIPAVNPATVPLKSNGVGTTVAVGTPSGADIALRDALSRSAGGLFTVTAARTEAASGRATLDIVLTIVGNTFDKAREQVVRAAAHAARSAAAADARLKSVSIQVAIQGGVSSANPTAMPPAATVFRGEITPAALSSLDPINAGLADLVARFNSLQWFPPLNPAPETATTPAGGIPNSNGLAEPTPAATP